MREFWGGDGWCLVKYCFYLFGAEIGPPVTHGVYLGEVNELTPPHLLVMTAVCTHLAICSFGFMAWND